MVFYHHANNYQKRSSGLEDIQTWKIEQSDWPRAFDPYNSRTRIFLDMWMVLSDFLQYGAHFRTFSAKSNEGNLKYIRKGPFLSYFGPFLPNLGQMRIFPKNRAPSLFILYGPLTSCKKPEKTDEPILRKMRYERTDEQGWIHRTFPPKAGVQLSVTKRFLKM